MTQNRKKSDLEALMAAVLREKKRALTLGEVVAEIKKTEPSAFTGKTPTNSLYSIIYRREKRRVENGEQPFFLVHKDRSLSVYSINTKHK